jgi:hypothetical protein
LNNAVASVGLDVLSHQKIGQTGRPVESDGTGGEAVIAGDFNLPTVMRALRVAAE